MEALKRQRAAIKGQVTRIVSHAKEKDITHSKANSLILRLEHLMNDFDRVQTCIEEDEADEIHRAEFESIFYEVHAQLTDIIRCKKGNLPSGSGDLSDTLKILAEKQTALGDIVKHLVETSGKNTPITCVESNTRLPEIKLPEFSGRFDEWVRFRDLFIAMVYSKASLTGVEKMEYLQTRLRGDAASLIRHLAPSNTNFEVAWNLIKSHFDKPNIIMVSHLDNIFESAVLKTGSLSDIKVLFSNINENVNALRALSQPVDDWKTLLIYVLAKKLDSENRILWYRKIKDISNPSLTDFTGFLTDRINELECVNTFRAGRNNQQIGKSMPKDSNKRMLNVHTSNISPSCVKCKRNHLLYQCKEFRELPVTARLELVTLNKICSNCLRSRHVLSECKFSVCKVCSEKHNTLLHQNVSNANPGQPSVSGTNDVVSSGLSVNASQHGLRDTFTMLPTAVVSVMDANGQMHECRALLDSGSQSTLISEACVQRLRLKRSHARIPISGIGQDGCTQGTNGLVSLVVGSSAKTDVILTTKAYILSVLTGNIPSVNIPRSKISFFDHLILADPGCCTPRDIDIVFGADQFFEILTEGRIIHPTGSPVAQNTKFGWVIAGNASTEAPTLNLLHAKVDLDSLLRRFWEYEDIKDSQHSVTDEAQQIEEHFVSTHGIQSDGRYVVRLPFKRNIAVEFGDSRKAALRRLHAMERSFLADPNLQREYIAFMQEYEDLGHVAPVSPIRDNPQQSFYLPHHAVLKPSSTTTKLRVVFDASCKSSNGSSLNDCLQVGPTIQNDLITSLIRFRKFAIAVKADIAKMYRQIRIHNSDINYQRIIWRKNPSEKPQDYQLLTVTYGTAPASFLATRVLKQVGINSLPYYPQASASIINDFYVDDYMSDFHSLEEALVLKNDLHAILNGAGLDLRKWASNSLEFLADIEPSCREISTDLSFNRGEVKTLGLIWDTISDSFKFSFSTPSLNSQITKREVLSHIARMFDPLGWLSPVIVKLKVFMKKLWILKVGWDTFIPPDCFEEWASFSMDLNQLSLVSLPRWIGYTQQCSVELHGFADASESAYAAAIYFRVVKADGGVYTSLLCAKSRVAPVKPSLTIPRLELCGSLLLTRLFTKVKDALGVYELQCFAYTDSSTVLHWIKGYPRPRNVFADNRLSIITAQLPASAWHYVRSAENPADCATRGLMPKHLPRLDIWWKGPFFLRDPVVVFNELPSMKETTENDSMTSLRINMEPAWDIFAKFSNFNRLLRVVARCLSWRNRLKSCNLTRPTCILSPQNIKEAKIVLFKLAQHQDFSSELACLRRNQPVHAKSKISRMNPFIDDHGILRVGGRLQNANIPFEQKHPVILHKDHQLVNLIVLDCHNENMHAGIRQMSYLLSLHYFVIGLHHSIKRNVYQCVICTRQRGTPYTQQMANLPRQRLEPGVAFGSTGVDFAGPFTIRSWKGRGAKQYKAYISLFICMATKALHLEAVTELSSDAFIAALRRFVARRGKCHTIFSDNGTNFVGANRQLREWTMIMQTTAFQESVFNELTTKSINWQFIPPHAPHFGGLWEAGVKTVKYHLRRTLGDSSVTFEEFTTLLCQVEACANSRPLCAKFDGDIDPLTPAHFLIMRSMGSVPDQNLLNTDVTPLRRWQYLQRLVQEFWRKWSTDYLSQLQRRPKWANKMKNINVNDVVIVKEDNQSPCDWLVGRITFVHPGRDGLVRVASVMTSKGEIKRPICKLCPLFIDGC